VKDYRDFHRVYSLQYYPARNFRHLVLAHFHQVPLLQVHQPVQMIPAHFPEILMPAEELVHAGQREQQMLA
jgi:hypothetical protein